MPDDEKVTEHVDQTPSPDTEADESTAFDDDSDSDEIMETMSLERGEEKETPEPDKEGEEEVEEEEPVEEEETPSEEDEDILRGKELLGEEEKPPEEEKETPKEEEDAFEEKPTDGDYSDVFTKELQADDLDFYNAVVPEKLLPKEVTLKDGTVLDFDSWRDENPEAIPAITAVAHNLITQMIANGLIATTQNVSKIESSLDSKLFDRTVTHKEYGVPKANEIKESKDFKDWLKDEPKEINALMKSKDPYDHIRVYKRFLNKSGVEEAKKKAEEIDKKRKVSKEKFDAVHKTTPRPSQKRSPKAELEGKEQEKLAFESDDDEDDLY